MLRRIAKLLPYQLRIEMRRFARSMKDLLTHSQIARNRLTDLQGYDKQLTTHSSKLIRKVEPSKAHLQHNKVQNLRLACAAIDGLQIKPGEVFSFCSLVGRTTYKRGYVDGLEMHQGEMVGAAGGGLCQLANLIFWMAVHLNLEIIERHRHELDLFPDDERVVPFGMGASIFYNYRDLRFRNTLKQTLVLSVKVSEPLLKGAFWSDTDKDFDVQISEPLNRFIRRADGQIWRENKVVKTIVNMNGEKTSEPIAYNLGRVCYHVPDHLISDDTF